MGNHRLEGERQVRSRCTGGLRAAPLEADTYPVGPAGSFPPQPRPDTNWWGVPPPPPDPGEAAPHRLDRHRSTRVAVAIVVALGLVVAGVAAFLALGPGTTAFTAGPPLGYRWRAGEVQTFVVTTTANGSIAEPGHTMRFQRTLMRTVRFTVLGVDAEGTATIALAGVGHPRDACTIDPPAAGGCLEASAHPAYRNLRIGADGAVLDGSGLGLLNGGPAAAWLPGLEQFLPLLPQPSARTGSVWRGHASPTVGTGDGQLQVDVDDVFRGYVQDFGQRLPQVTGVMNVPMDLPVNITAASAVAGLVPPHGGATPGPTLRFLEGTLVIRQLAEACDELYQVSNWGNYQGQVEPIGFDDLPDRVATLDFSFELSLRRLDLAA
jgi:hypothetical protein